VPQYILTKPDFLTWLNALAKEYQVLVPREEDKEYSWGLWDGRTMPDKTYHNTLKPPKDLFFTQHEVLLKYRKEKGKKPVIEEPDLPWEKRIIFGLRPCDARSLMLLDHVFLSTEYQDPFYAARRKNTLIISLVCEKPGPGCFCSEPFTTEGADLLLVDLDDRYLVETVTVRGEKALNSAVSSTPDQAIMAQVEELKTKLALEIAAVDLTEKLDLNHNNPIWQELQEKCLNCGVCSFLCPTCHCFDITDNRQGQKVRSWDSCMFTGFTKQASGHNPRPTGTERLRQRVMHKFKYFPEKYGLTACVGCGRCVEKCPVNLDIRQVLLKLKGVL